MKEIKPIYVTFEQAKKLKEKGFDVECKYYYNIEFKELSFHIGYVGDIYKNSEMSDKISAPEQWQVIEWFRVKCSIWVTTDRNDFNKFKWIVEHDLSQGSWETPQEATSAAIDYVLDNLI